MHFEGLTNEQEMCSRILEWKGIGFTMSPRYIRRTISHCKVARTTNMLYMKALSSGEKGKMSSYFMFSFVKKKKTDRTYDLKLNALLIFCNSLGSCSDLMSHGFQMLSLEIMYSA